MTDDTTNSQNASGHAPEDDLFKNFSSSPLDDNKPATNSIALSTMLEPDDDGFISTDQLDAVFGNKPTNSKESAPQSSGISAPPKMRLKSNETTGAVPQPQTPQLRPTPPSTSMDSRPVEKPEESSTPAPAMVQSAPSGLKVHPENKSIKIVGSISTDNASVGQILQEARVCLELSLTQVEQQTKIKRSFLEAVERDDLKNLPAMCYVSAYIKTLCQLYRIDNETSAALLATLKEKKGDRSVPNEILQNLENDKHINFEEEAKVKKYVSIAVVAILLVTGFVAFKVWSPEEPQSFEQIKTQIGRKAPVEGDSSIYFNEKELEIFIPTAEVYMSTLSLED